jgi:hypothetical protein
MRLIKVRTSNNLKKNILNRSNIYIYRHTQTLAWVLVLIRGSCRHLIFVDEDSLHLIILLKKIKIIKEYAA